MSLNDRILKSQGQSSALLYSLSSTYTDYSTYPLAKERVTVVQQQLDALKGPLESAHLSTTREYEDFKSLDKSHVRKSFSKFTRRGEKFDAEKDKEEREWREAWQREEDLKSQQATLQEELRQTEQERDRTADVWRQHNEKQVELDDLYFRTFAGPTPEYPEQEHARALYDTEINRFTEAQRRTDTAHRVVQCLQDADMNFQQACRKMGQAKDMSDWDIMGGGAMVSARKREDMNLSQQSVMMAERCVFEAHTLDPEVPVMGRLDVGAQGSGMTDMMFDNIFTDMRVRDEIKGSAVNLVGKQDDNKRKLQQAQQKLDARRAELTAAVGKRNESRWELQRVRAGIYDRVANGGGTASNASYGGGASNTNYGGPGYGNDGGMSSNYGYESAPPAYS